MLYSWDKIKEIGDCVEFCRVRLGMKPIGKSGTGIRFKSVPWRAGSDSKAFCVTRSGWIDHTNGDKGSILDLCARTMFGGDLMQSQKYLGELYGLEPLQVKRKRKIECVYDYKDLEGNLKHQTVRWFPKEFTQRRPDPDNPDKWIWNLIGIEPVLYRHLEWVDEETVFVVGGEKDVDNLFEAGLFATTNAMGEGHWREHYNECFQGKNVVVIPDNDDVGRAHAATVCKNLDGVAKSIRLLELSGLPEKGDVSDYLEDHNKDDLVGLVRQTAVWTTDEMPSEAKQANALPFMNYRYEDQESETGRKKRVKVARHINDMREDVFKRFWGFPRRVGTELFDHDRKKDDIRFIENAAALFAWIEEKSGHNIDWGRIQGACNQSQFYESVVANAQYYDSISCVPTFPPREDVYYTHGEMPEPSENAKYFEDFCEFFCPATEEDRELIRVAVAAPLYYKRGVPCPMWVIDAVSGQGTGKTKLVEMIANLYGGNDCDSAEPIWVDFKQINNETMLDRVQKRLLSRAGRKKRIVLIDNIEGHFDSPALATLASQSAISGIAPYGRGEETRPNDLTYFLTSNSAMLHPDLVSRCLMITLKRPENPIRQWELKVMSFIQKHRLQIIADIRGIMEAGCELNISPSYRRFHSWETEVMMPIINDTNWYEKVFKLQCDRWAAADMDLEEADILREYFKAKIEEHIGNPDQNAVWLQGPVLLEWTGAAIKNFGGRTNRAAVRILRNMSKSGKFPELSHELTIWPNNGMNRRRGMMWNIEQHKLDPESTKILGYKNDVLQRLDVGSFEEPGMDEYV